MLKGINHITYSIRSLKASLEFYVGVLGCRMLAKWDRGVYLSAGGLWMCLRVDPPQDCAPASGYTHLAFSVEPNDFSDLSRKIVDSGAKIWQDNHTEGDSLYFCDPDGHQLEIHATTLEARLESARKSPWKSLIIYD